MKANNNKTTFNEHTNICAWVQFYYDNGKYDELFIEAVKHKDIPQPVIESFEENHDITLYVAPGDMVGVFAKNPQDIMDYVNGFYGTEGLKALLGKRIAPSSSALCAIYLRTSGDCLSMV